MRQESLERRQEEGLARGGGEREVWLFAHAVPLFCNYNAITIKGSEVHLSVRCNPMPHTPSATPSLPREASSTCALHIRSVVGLTLFQTWLTAQTT